MDLTFYLPSNFSLFFCQTKQQILKVCSCKDENPLLLIQNIFDTLSEATVLLKLNLPNAYHLIRIKEGDKWMTAIKMPFGVFKYYIIPIGLCNSPAVFQHFMNHVL
jgi:hypothetical protein